MPSGLSTPTCRATARVAQHSMKIERRGNMPRVSFVARRRHVLSVRTERDVGPSKGGDISHVALAGDLLQGTVNHFLACRRWRVHGPDHYYLPVCKAPEELCCSMLDSGGRPTYIIEAALNEKQRSIVRYIVSSFGEGAVAAETWVDVPGASLSHDIEGC